MAEKKYSVRIRYDVVEKVGSYVQNVIQSDFSNQEQAQSLAQKLNDAFEYGKESAEKSLDSSPKL